MKAIEIGIAALLVLTLFAGCTSNREPNDSSDVSGSAEISGIFDAKEVVRQYRKAINQDDAAMAKSFFGDTVLIGTIEGGETVTYTKEQMDSMVDECSYRQQEYNQDEYIDAGDYWVIVEGYEPDYISTMVWGFEREQFKMRTKYVVKNDLITEIYAEPNEEQEALIAKKTEGAVGVECEIQEDKLFVSAIREDYPAEKAGLEVGDEILSIDDVLTEDMRLIADEHLYRMRGELGTSVTLEISRDGKAKEITMKRSA